MEAIKNFIKTNKIIVIAVVVVIIISIILMSFKSNFNPTINGDNISLSQPSSFPPIEKKDEEINLLKPDVPEEIGLAMVYPQGKGVGMDKSDSNSFYPDKPGPLLTEHVGPESYGESSLSDPTGYNGANQGARILKIKNLGSQSNFKPIDDSRHGIYAGAYNSADVQKGSTFINGNEDINYSDTFVPDDNLKIQTSPGQSSTLSNCETTIPNVVKYNDFCITAGDIPYGQVVDGKVNPRLVSRWESLTGDYSRDAALAPIDGVLYPKLNTL